jgi:hypothetical protein
LLQLYLLILFLLLLVLSAPSSPSRPIFYRGIGATWWLNGTYGSDLQSHRQADYRELRSWSGTVSKTGFAATWLNAFWPFLVYMQNRCAKRPFFVMWVANAELLQKR